mmetsp:Transcript_8383/g.4509  ORF Transcript_8383/g.4509 Transcript_8383/m.4509 type:complete len:403 (+) Transcript_8383:2368-3576(+)
MEYNLSVNKNTARVKVSVPEENNLNVVIGESQFDVSYTMISSNLIHLKISNEGNKREINAYVANELNGKRVLINGISYLVQDVNHLAQCKKKKKDDEDISDIITPFTPAVVISVMVNAGDMVEKGQGVIVLSAMKMETTLVSPFDGKVTKVNFAKDDRVSPGDILVDIEKAGQIEEKLIIANCSGFFGDRFTAAKEMVSGGDIHILTGDYLAELTMALLFQTRLKNPEKGYVSTFLKQMEEIIGVCLDKNIRVVTNAGGLNPRKLADELERKADIIGLKPTIACIEGDDLMGRLDELQKSGETFTHMDKGISLKKVGAQPITANVYIGGWGITKALSEGADIVVGGRIADAALVSGPAAWKFGWKQNGWDKLAGALCSGTHHRMWYSSYWRQLFLYGRSLFI